MIRLTELKRVLGRRLLHRLLQAELIVPSSRDARGHPLFDPQSVHRTLGTLARGIGLIEPRRYQPQGNGTRRAAKKDELEKLLSCVARSLE